MYCLDAITGYTWLLVPTPTLTKPLVYKALIYTQTLNLLKPNTQCNINASLWCDYVLYSPDPLFLCACASITQWFCNSIYSFVMLVTVCPINFISPGILWRPSCSCCSKAIYQSMTVCNQYSVQNSDSGTVCTVFIVHAWNSTTCSNKFIKHKQLDKLDLACNPPVHFSNLLSWIKS